MLWHELTSPQVAALDREMPVVIPLGSIEQHGNHLPLAVDTIQLQGISSRVEEKLREKILFTPVLWLGASHHHLDFPGPISVPPTLYSNIIQEIAMCFLRHGFRRLFFLNGHGGNFVPTSHALSDLIAKDDRADAATIALGSWFGIAAQEILPAKVGTETPVVTHACEYETSLMLALRDDLVRLGDISPEHREEVRPWTRNPKFSRVEGFHRFHRWTSTGHMGHPELATVEKGQRILENSVAAVAEFLQEFATWPHMPVLKKIE